MIIDLPRFIETERPTWKELESLLDLMSGSSNYKMTLDQAQRFHFLYQKASADLGRVSTFASEPALRRYLESLVARSYAEIHETRGRDRTWRPLHWFFVQFPAVFRRHIGAFWISIMVSFLGAFFGGTALLFDEDAKAAIVPQGFEHVLQDPVDRVLEEESGAKGGGDGNATFAGFLMQNNIKVSIRALALGLTMGVGTILVLLQNGIFLGQVVADYVNAGEGVFLAAWLLPHGSFELPAIFIAGQGGLILARAIIGRGDRAPLAARLRAVSKDVMTIIGGVAIMLVWAGIVESYMSQHHEPRLPYWIKITFGTLELIILTIFLSSGWWSKSRKVRKEARV
ncbi:MAG TPA: stage II sporulation protein M [Chthoniobacteraceae bacterium]|nr:stage II sporulation protein M [Chthoniobacteraceae bacterium]